MMLSREVIRMFVVPSVSFFYQLNPACLQMPCNLLLSPYLIPRISGLGYIPPPFLLMNGLYHLINRIAIPIRNQSGRIILFYHCTPVTLVNEGRLTNV